MKHVSPLKAVVNRTPAHSPTPSVFNKTPTGSQGKEYAHLQEASIQVNVLHSLHFSTTKASNRLAWVSYSSCAYLAGS